MGNEFVMVPRELAERIAKICMFTMYKEDYRAISEILDKPAEQHQGAPVALPERRDPLFVVGSAYDDGLCVGFNECLDEIAKLGPLYTHADPGEVERLRGIIRMHEKTVREQADHLAYMRAQLAEMTTKRDRLREGMDNANININNWFKDNQKLEAQLAERDALLVDIRLGGLDDERCARVDLLLSSGAYENAINKHPLLRTSSDNAAIEAALSASAEPSMPKYHRQSLDMDDTVRDRLTTIARKAVISSTHRYNYMPATPEDAIGWQPHAWVVEAMRMVEVKACVEVNDLNELLVHAESVQAELSGALEEVLDERDTVLAKVRWLLSEATHDDGAISAAQFEKECLAMLKQINTILSASAEPSAPECKYCGDTGQIMVGRSGDASDGNAPIMEPCEDCDGPSAPVEIDERAAFEKAVVDKAERFHPNLEQYGENPDADYRDASIEWAWGLWKARAALEQPK